jgi:nitronate monooxygenase
MIVDSSASDILYTNLFTGVHGNYLRPSVVQAGFDPDHLPEGDPATMNFASGDKEHKVWRDIWGSGQGIGAVKATVPVAQLVDRLAYELENQD